MTFIQLLPLAASVVSTAPQSSLSVAIEGPRNSKGVFQLCLTARERGFPDCSRDAAAIKMTVPATTRSVKLTGIVPGRYALTLFHDQNNNRRLDTMLGIPREGFAFSRNPVIRFGAPKFSQVAVQLVAGDNSHRVRLQYLL